MPHTHLTYLPNIWKLWLCCCALGLLGLSGCKTVGSFYSRPRTASYYTNRYCFEMSKEPIIQAVRWLLQHYNFPVVHEDLEKGRFDTKPVYMSRFSRDPRWGYTVALSLQVIEYKDKIQIAHIPAWVFEKKLPPSESRPERSQFADQHSFDAAHEKYMQTMIKRSEYLDQGVKLMRQWQGCDVRTSQLRTAVEVKASFMAYPIGAFGRLKRDQGRKEQSRLTLEYSILRVIAWRIKRLKHMPELIQ